jgi:hypothetical protein
MAAEDGGRGVIGEVSDISLRVTPYTPLSKRSMPIRPVIGGP